MTTAVDQNINTWLSQIQNEYKAAVSVDCVIFGYDETTLRVLTLRSDMPPYEGMGSLVGDLLRPEETLDEAASRILKQRTGLEEVPMEQVQAFSKVNRHPLARVITIAYYSLVNLTEDILERSESSDLVEWKSITEVGDLAFDHNEIMNTCLQSLRAHVRESPIGFSLLPQKFSLKQLQHLYELVLDIKLDKRNFRRKLRSLDLLIDLDEIQQGVNHRPAQLYTFDAEKYKNKRKQGFSFEL